eukprot:3927234-Amphidinium_carterae.2
MVSSACKQEPALRVCVSLTCVLFNRAPPVVNAQDSDNDLQQRRSPHKSGRKREGAKLRGTL